jgi:hypothetical protein
MEMIGKEEAMQKIISELWVPAFFEREKWET